MYDLANILVHFLDQWNQWLVAAVIFHPAK